MFLFCKKILFGGISTRAYTRTCCTQACLFDTSRIDVDTSLSLIYVYGNIHIIAYEYTSTREVD